MSIASFAGKVFQVSSKKIYTFSDFTTGGSLQIEKQDVTGKKPSTYIKGSDLETMSFSVPMKESLGINIEAEYNSWKAIKDAAKAQNFILGNKPFSGKWLLTGVNLSNTLIDKKGRIIEGVLQLQFEEYVRSGSASDSSSAKKTTTITAKGVSAADKSILDALVSGEEKTSQKRTNTNVSEAIARGKKALQ